MIVEKRVRLIQPFKNSRGRLLFLLGYSTLVVVLYKQGLSMDLPAFVPAILGTVLSILLGFRTNSAYGRWWEARKIWGAIVNDSRSFARQSLTLLGKSPDEGTSTSDIPALQKELIYRHMAWNMALNRSLRKQEPWDELSTWLGDEEIADLRSQSNICVALLQTQAKRLREARDRGDLDVFTWMQFDSMLTRFSDSMGMCERIKSTVFPTTYSNLVAAGIMIFYLLIPLGLVDNLGWGAVPICFLLGGVFRLIEVTSYMIQDPFENQVSDTAMDTICRTIEINLRQQLGETDLPPPLEPINGVLM